MPRRGEIADVTSATAADPTPPTDDDGGEADGGGTSDSGTVMARINPRLWKIDRHVATREENGETVEYEFTHEPRELSAEAYEELAKFTTVSDGHDRQVIVKARAGGDQDV